jgi:hypothetical protein
MSFVQNRRVEWLLSRSYGQGGTVALPSSNIADSSPEGDFPAGVQDVLNRLGDQYGAWSPSNNEDVPVEWCFLIGGPGNGKSEALRVLAGALNVPLPPKATGQPAPRTLPANWPPNAIPVVAELEIVLINDASIPRPDALAASQLGSLSLDLIDGINRFLNHQVPIILFGNVNRGILVEEESKIGAHNLENETQRLAAEIINWLLHPPSEPVPNSRIKTVVPIDPRKPYYGQFSVPLKELGAKYNVLTHVVFLDTLSLLEPAPKIISSPGKATSVDFSVTPPSLAEYHPFGGFSDNFAQREQTIAGELVSKLVRIEEWEEDGCIHHGTGTLCQAFATCPFVQNAKWLRATALKRNFLDFLRAAEIAASRRLTYRDLLGHLSLAILGSPQNSWLAGQHPCNWVEDRVRNLEDERSKREATAALVGHRIYNNLFPPPDTAAWNRIKERPLTGDTLYAAAIHQMTLASKSSRTKAFEQAFNDIDPARDFESWNGTRERVLSIIESLDVPPLPSQELLVGGLISPEAHSRIEIMLDQALPQEIANELSHGLGKSRLAASNRSNLLRKWRNTLLLRQVGLATGHMAFKVALSAWLAEQANALKESASLGLGKGIEALILPAEGSGQFLLAPFRPRTYNLPGNELPAHTILVAVPLGDLRVEIVPRGDVLTAEVLQATGRELKMIASLVIDLAIAREAILQRHQGATSFTEIGTSAFARIERVRASLIGRHRLKKATIYYTDQTGKIYRVTSNPTGSPPLRVTLGERP